eukprot:CAMPEP_0194362238 /NCGR_PEP_ID=MMETSP0174-20130528/9965_1 /TAXON_ID=216777 /ORGANISM="Proboscia alata, Strain PI-D3" /LENGTH=228 /DNA_ID=CAMNT_0039134981 /DNA_START=28 /DNA_END=711 /DNA_ORIENTATION=-
MLDYQTTRTAIQSASSGWIGKSILALFTILGSFRYGVGLYAWRAAERLEKPSFVSVKKLPGGVDLRRYDSYLIAETTVPKEGFRESTGDGFRACAGYIFGKNKASKQKRTALQNSDENPPRPSSDNEKMAMTAPVRVNGGGKSGTKVSFVIGSKYSLSSAPKPLDKNVRLREVRSHYLATRNFSGPPPTDERVRLERQRIDVALEQSNMRPAADGETFVYGYHDPFIT